MGKTVIAPKKTDSENKRGTREHIELCKLIRRIIKTNETKEQDEEINRVVEQNRTKTGANKCLLLLFVLLGDLPILFILTLLLRLDAAMGTAFAHSGQQAQP